MTDCSTCGIEHATKAEALEVHGASKRIHEWLKERIQLVVNEPVAPLVGKLHIRPARKENTPWAQVNRKGQGIERAETEHYRRGS